TARDPSAQTRSSSVLRSKENWLLLCNAQSLLYKMDEMRALVTILKPTFVCITETWLTPAIDNDLVSIPGSTIFRNDRRDDTSDSRRGGGTVIFASYAVMPVNIDAGVISLSKCNVEKPKGIECNLVKFCDPNIAYLLCIYIPPALSAETFSLFQDYIVHTFDCLLNATPNADIFICGDLNRYDFSFLTRLFDIYNIVKEPTFGNAILDKFYCNDNLMNTFNGRTRVKGTFNK
ncbi:MAG: endonuclease/exonuclease/phosphatase family protein, partial [Pseudomonadota bacterium]